MSDPAEGARGRLPLPTLRDPSLQAAFDRDGILVVPVLDPASARDLRARLLEIMPEDPGEFFDLFRNNPPPLRKQIDRFVRAELTEVAESILADHDFWSAAAIVKPPGAAGEIGLHTDWTMVDERRFRSGLLWLALDDTCEENGSLLAVPGTHRLDIPYRGRDIHFPYQAPDVAALIDERIVRVDVPAGHAAIWDNRLLHGSGPNRTETWRVAVALGFKPRSAGLRHYRRQPGNVAQEYFVTSEFYLDYEPFDPDYDVTGCQVSDGELLPIPAWELTARELRSLSSGGSVLGTVQGARVAADHG
jgi:hypothetical protein